MDIGTGLDDWQPFTPSAAAGSGANRVGLRPGPHEGRHGIPRPASYHSPPEKREYTPRGEHSAPCTDRTAGGCQGHSARASGSGVCARMTASNLPAGQCRARTVGPGRAPGSTPRNIRTDRLRPACPATHHGCHLRCAIPATRWHPGGGASACRVCHNVAILRTNPLASRLAGTARRDRDAGPQP